MKQKQTAMGHIAPFMKTPSPAALQAGHSSPCLASKEPPTRQSHIETPPSSGAVGMVWEANCNHKADEKEPVKSEAEDTGKSMLLRQPSRRV